MKFVAGIGVMLKPGPLRGCTRKDPMTDPPRSSVSLRRGDSLSDPA
ncbi:MAG: hypothetical protein OEV30_04315 [Ignavibacteria bacterium]|nr:hypothetical protein [Ignavibacteria bacterium]